MDFSDAPTTPTHKNKEGDTKTQTSAADRKQYLTEKNTFSTTDQLRPASVGLIMCLELCS